ncbi:YwqI/YxiC family protein [Robertmurraya andreesenii]|uniref:Uncharacterized protein n=1 Tax=Anoxybacillus andreesenii TaxID=1325932 RepID=A0ABT9V162_9BACL|nr:YwqI/YxiC family protein [Robertmurraya andreesenii]MDQ0154679.1 hypothetical protein [Robertmurraya andreesenii]
MSVEVKWKYSEIDEALVQLKEKAGLLQTTFPTAIGERNALDVVTRLNELGVSLEQLLLEYKAFLHRSEKATNEAVQQWIETDGRISKPFIGPN